MPRTTSCLRTKAALFVLGTSLFVPAMTSACPGCPVGKAARQEVWNDDFEGHLLMAVAPFLVVGMVARRAERLRRNP